MKKRLSLLMVVFTIVFSIAGSASSWALNTGWQKVNDKDSGKFAMQARATLTHTSRQHKGAFEVVDKIKNDGRDAYGYLEGGHYGRVCWPKPGGCLPSVMWLEDGGKEGPRTNTSKSYTLTLAISNGVNGQSWTGKVTTRMQACQAIPWWFSNCSKRVNYTSTP